ncbi:hypothetical protein [Marinifilum flexuosum]|uniref:Uncharacterized protein n=1 Tax=Marinifilum flexuosum TaxID=1117708 RepID=A0A419WMN1_9BACT|nr:hypothetical protein [Marinifilum flexuosum]RKD96743.1 hypothetical protein BXY64_3689 [Marinifilum flexuosum]
MSEYYKIKGLKVRVSDHEPNFSMDRIRGRNNVELYTVDACGTKLSVISQIERYCEKNDLNIELFSEIIKDYPDEEYVPSITIEKVEVTAEFIEGYHAISGKGSMKKKDRYCEKYGIDSFKVSQGYYIVK